VQLRAWRQYQIKDKFILERHLKKGSIFIAGEQQVYLVSGITSPLSDMIFAEMLPLILETVIMPFKGKIVYAALPLFHSFLLIPFSSTPAR
jgi:hypothetical protein